MSDLDGLDDLGAELAALEGGMDTAQAMTRAFSAELGRMQAELGKTGQGLRDLDAGFSRSVRQAIDGVVLDGRSLSEALRGVARAMADTAYSAAMRPVASRAGAVLAQGVEGIVAGLLPFRDGAPFGQGRVVPFARGGVVTAATTFAMRGATGLMGEAGPEAILPLARGADGRLGVRGQGGGAVTVTMNISTPDVQGFQRSQGQIAAQLGRALSRGQRNR